MARNLDKKIYNIDWIVASLLDYSQREGSMIILWMISEEIPK